jgi:hypothetical protein
MRGMQFLAYHFKFHAGLQHEMYIASWYFLPWYCTGSCTGQVCYLQYTFSCVLQIFYALYGMRFSVTDWQYETFRYFARIFRSVSDWQKFSAENFTARGIFLSSTYAILQECFHDWRLICKFWCSNCKFAHLAERIPPLFLWVKSANALG